MIAIRSATEDDFEYCRKTEFTSVKDTPLRQSIQNGWVYIAEVNEQPIGYARLEFIWLTVPYLALIILEENQRGKGIGTKLMDHIFKELRQQGHEKIFTSSEVMEPEPQKFHRKCGFVEFAT